MNDLDKNEINFLTDVCINESIKTLRYNANRYRRLEKLKLITFEYDDMSILGNTNYHSVKVTITDLGKEFVELLSL